MGKKTWWKIEPLENQTLVVDYYDFLYKGFNPSFVSFLDTFTVNCTKTLIMGKYGSSVVLPCWLNPETNAESLEIRWYRPGHFQTPILLYQNHKIITDPQEVYSNRSSFTTRDSQSTGLKQGDVSLRLDNIGMSDTGIFHCYVNGDKSYDDNNVKVNLTGK